jgi:uncharacterized Zn finger protein
MTTPDPDNLVEPQDACPLCGERRADCLVWRDDERVECTMCGTVFRPGATPTKD